MQIVAQSTLPLAPRDPVSSVESLRESTNVAPACPADHLFGPPQAVERALLLFDLIPGAELHRFDECGHWVQWDQAPRLNQLVSTFLKAGT